MKANEDKAKNMVPEAISTPMVINTMVNESKEKKVAMEP